MAELVSDMVDVAAPGGVADAYVSRPADGRSHPGVVVFMDAFGIRAALEAHARRLAGCGYCVLVPNVFYRDGRSPIVENIEERIRAEDRSQLFDLIKPRIAALTPEAQRADAGAWLAALRGRPEVSTGP